MAARPALRRLAQQLRGMQRSFASSQPQQRSSGLLGACERQGMVTLRSCERSRLLRQRGSAMPTLVGRSGRAALAAWRALHHSLAACGVDDDGT
ncbi:hypothetical protein HT031_002873 [Scenedesmus sp. PABB004]|nr:hypothetical protein HT031_002873 [Scenedesmus sp. PABB004]